MKAVDIMVMSEESNLNGCEAAINATVDEIKSLANDRPEMIAASMGSYLNRLQLLLAKRDQMVESLKMLKYLQKEEG